MNRTHNTISSGGQPVDGVIMQTFGHILLRSLALILKWWQFSQVGNRTANYSILSDCIHKIFSFVRHRQQRIKHLTVNSSQPVRVSHTPSYPPLSRVTIALTTNIYSTYYLQIVYSFMYYTFNSFGLSFCFWNNQNMQQLHIVQISYKV